MPKNCEANIDYTEAMIKDVLCRGLEESEIQMDLLGNRNQDMILEQVFGFVETKEAGKRSAFHLLLAQVTDAVARSSYRKQKMLHPETKESSTQGPRNPHVLWSQGAQAKSPNKNQEEGMSSFWHQVQLL